MKKFGDCKLCKAKAIEYTKSDIVPKWFIKGFKDGPNGGSYIDVLRGKPGEIGARDDAYFVDDQALCKKCNNELLSGWEEPAKSFYDHYVAGSKGQNEYGPWFYSFCTSLSWRVLTYLHRVADNRTNLDDNRVSDALESWRLFMLTGDESHIGYHSQHIFLADPKYGNGISKSFRLFDVVHLTAEEDRRLLNTLEMLVGAYTPTQMHRVAAARNKIGQAGWGDDLLSMIFFGTFTFVGVVGTDQPDKWKKCGRLAVKGGALELSNSVNFRLLMGMLSHELKMWTRLHEKGDEKMARAYYAMMIEPGVAVLCCAAGV
jgi:hypothetical protein